MLTTLKMRVNVELMRSFLKIDLNRFLGCKKQIFNAWNTPLKKLEHIDSTLTLSFSTLDDVMISRIHTSF